MLNYLCIESFLLSHALLTLPVNFDYDQKLIQCMIKAIIPGKMSASFGFFNPTLQFHIFN